MAAVLDKRYKLMNRIGVGGFAEVYRAQDLESGLEVAVKILKTGMEKELVERFLREAKSMEQMDHPNVLKVFNHGFDHQQEKYYYAMEFIKGILNPNKEIFPKFSLKNKLEIVLQAAKGLRYIHKNNMVHRDIKPDNLLTFFLDPSKAKTVKNQIITARENIKTKVSDLGIAKQILATALTLSGVTMGTPWYMSPEQVKESKSVDYRTDIYSLGATLYHFITGKPPYGELSSNQVIAQKINMEDPQTPRQLNPNISTRIEDITMKALALDKSKRYQTISEFTEDLLKYLENEAAERLTHTLYSEGFFKEPKAQPERLHDENQGKTNLERIIESRRSERNRKIIESIRNSSIESRERDKIVPEQMRKRSEQLERDKRIFEQMDKALLETCKKSGRQSELDKELFKKMRKESEQARYTDKTSLERRVKESSLSAKQRGMVSYDFYKNPLLKDGYERLKKIERNIMKMQGKFNILLKAKNSPLLRVLLKVKNVLLEYLFKKKTPSLDGLFETQLDNVKEFNNRLEAILGASESSLYSLQSIKDDDSLTVRKSYEGKKQLEREMPGLQQELAKEQEIFNRLSYSSDKYIGQQLKVRDLERRLIQLSIRSRIDNNLPRDSAETHYDSAEQLLVTSLETAGLVLSESRFMHTILNRAYPVVKTIKCLWKTTDEVEEALKSLKVHTEEMDTRFYDGISKMEEILNS